MDNGKKNALNIVTTNDIRENARNWTLAGDVGLLAHLEQFSERIINKTQETQKNFDQLVDDYEELHTKVGNITNQFLALQNCQFVENRVYDEETPTEEQIEVKVENEGDQEKLLLMQYKEVVEVGIKLLDTHFQEVQLPPNSDSDEDDEGSAGNSVIWKPKNPYASKKFPFLIGSAEWWADDHVGLRPNEDVLEDKIESETESDVESLKSIEKTTKLSSSSSMENVKSIPTKPPFLESSEDLFGFDRNQENDRRNNDEFSKGSNSLSEEPINFLPDFEREGESEPKIRGEVIGEQKTRETEEKSRDEEVKNPKKMDNEFTRELMAKLVSVTNKTEKPEEKKEVIIPPPRKINAEDSLFDETDDSSDLFSTNVRNVREKSESERGLFFEAENDDDLFKGENDLFSGSSLFEPNSFKKPEEKNVLEPPKETKIPKKKKEEEEETPPKKTSVDDLFGDLDDDDTLFAVKPVTHKQIDQSSKEKETNEKTKSSATSGLSWGSEEGLFDNMDNEDDFFSSSGLFDTKVKKTEEPSTDVHSKMEEKPQKEKTPPKEPSKIETPKPQNLETKNSNDDPFGFTSSKKITILNPEDEEEEEDDLFSKKIEEKKPPIKTTTILLDDEDDDDAMLFGEKTKPPNDSISISSSRSSLFDDVTNSKSRLASVFEKNKGESGEESLFTGEGKPGKDLFSKKPKEEKTSLFEDCDDGDDLFGGVEKKVDLFQTKQDNLFTDDLFSENVTKNKPKPPSSLNLNETKTIGKLNIPDNLKARFESVAKHISPGGTKPITKEDGLEDVQPSGLLKCPSKDRVKIPGKRRPQSRRARQEAIRNSGTWDQPSDVVQPSKESPVVSNPLSPSTDEEDFFKVPELDTNFEKEDQRIFKSDLFESTESKLDDNLLFDGAPVLSPLTGKVKQTKSESHFDTAKNSRIFDEDDPNEDDESLFKPAKPKTTEMKKPLFQLDDDDDEDDLFGGKCHVTPKPPPSEKRKENEEKDKGNSSFVDPLGLISSNQ